MKVVKLVPPACSKFPPLAASYQSAVEPTGNVAVKVTFPSPQVLAPVATGLAGIALIVAVTLSLIELQPVVVFLACM
jgi:hypothetical protein